MNANLKVVLASGLAFMVLVVPGLSDVVHEAGGSTAVVGAVLTHECSRARGTPSGTLEVDRDWRTRARAARLGNPDEIRNTL